LFECEIKGNLIKNLITVISSVVIDGELIADADSITLNNMDESKVALVGVYIDKNFCEKYICDEETHLKLNFYELNKITSKIITDKIVNLKLIPESNKLQLKFKDKYTKTFTIPLLESIKCETVEEVNISSDVSITIPSLTFANSVKNALLINSIADFIVYDNNEFSIIVSSESKGDLRIDFEEIADKNINQKNVISKFSLKYVNDFLKAKVFSGQIKLEFSNDSPLILKFPIASDESNSRIFFFLAPQVTEIDEIEEEELEENVEEDVREENNTENNQILDNTEENKIADEIDEIEKIRDEI